MTCKLCKERGKTWSGDNPKCAFKKGLFISDNWNCATMNRLREISEEIGTRRRDNDESIGYVVLDNNYSDSDIGIGFIVMTWYKERGRTGKALIMCDYDDPRTLTEMEAEEAIRVHDILKL